MPVPKHVVLWIVLAAMTGCEDVSLNTAPGPQRPIRPAGEPIATRPAPAPAVSTPSSPPPPAAPRDESHYYQLVLVNGPAPQETAPTVLQIKIGAASARGLGDALAMLYLPAGVSGSAQRCTVIYPTDLEMRTAGEAVELLDTAEGDDTSPLPAAVARVLGVPLAPDVARAGQEAVDALNAIVCSEACPSRLRWAAAMLAGNVLMNRLYRYGDAASYYATAAGHAAPGSLEQLNAEYAQARALHRCGDRDRARQLLRQLIAQATGYRRTEPFLRGEELLGLMERQR